MCLVLELEKTHKMLIDIDDQFANQPSDQNFVRKYIQFLLNNNL